MELNNIESEEPVNCFIQQVESVKNASFEHIYIKQEFNNDNEDVPSPCKELMDENVEDCEYNILEDVEFSIDTVKTEIDTQEMEGVAMNDLLTSKPVLNEDNILKVKAPSRTYQRTVNRKRQIPSWGRDEPPQSAYMKQENVGDVNKQLPQIDSSVGSNINCENGSFKHPRLTDELSNVTSQCNQEIKSKNLVFCVKQFHQCLFCKKKLKNVFKHFLKRHNDQLLVKLILHRPRETQLQKLNLLKRVGDFQYNVHSLKNEEDNLIVLRISERFLGKSRSNQFLPCPDCTGFLHESQLFDHYPKCTAKKPRYDRGNKEKLMNESRLLLKHALISVSYETVLQYSFKSDVSETVIVAKNDECLYLLGKHMIKMCSHSDEILVDVRTMMHRMGCLLMSCRKIADEPTLTMRNILIPKNINLLFISVKTFLISNLQKEELISDLFSKITNCVFILRSDCLLDNELIKADKHLMFYYKFVETWGKEIDNLEVNKISDLPLMSHVINLKAALESSIIKLTNEIKTNQINIDNAWHDLAESTLCLLCLFNAAEFSAIERLKVSEYAVRPDWSADELEEYRYKLSNFTYCLAAKRFVVCINFCGNKLIILFTKIIKKAIDVLISNRHRTSISPRNEFVFVNNFEKGKTCFNSVTCFYDLCVKTGYLNHNLIRDFTKRRYLAFLTQLIDMSPEETAWAVKYFEMNEKIFRRSSLNVEDEVYQAFDIWRMYLKEETNEGQCKKVDTKK